MKHLSSNARKILKRVVSVTVSALVLIMILAVCYLMYCQISGKVAFIGNYATVKIITPSMEPTIPTGTYIIAEKVQAEAVQEGDVILFYSRDPAIYGKINTHRVVQVVTENGEHSFITKGDHNPENDSFPVYENDLVGRYVKNAENLTAFVGFFSKPYVFFLVVIIPAVWLVAVSIRDMVKKTREARVDRLVEEAVNQLKEEEKNSQEKEKTDDV